MVKKSVMIMVGLSFLLTACSNIITIPPTSFCLGCDQLRLPDPAYSDCSIESGTLYLAADRMGIKRCLAWAPIILPVGTEILSVHIIVNFSEERAECSVSGSLDSKVLIASDYDGGYVREVTESSNGYTFGGVDYIKALPIYVGSEGKGTTVEPYTTYRVRIHMESMAEDLVRERSYCNVPGVVVTYISASSEENR